jgi:hypothetical protein
MRSTAYTNSRSSSDHGRPVRTRQCFFSTALPKLHQDLAKVGLENRHIPSFFRFILTQEGASFISRTVTHCRMDRRCS